MKRSENPFFTQEQRKFIASDLKEKGLSEFQSEQFIITCERTLLDPFSRQIYARPQPVKKTFPGGSEEWVKELIIITAIDGLRAVAERSGEYRGQTPVEWFGTDPDTGKLNWLPFWSGVNPQFPEAARVGVHRETFREPLIGVARYHSYVQMTKGRRAEGSRPAQSPQPTSFWLKMPDVMLAKCAEAIALRKSFPLLLSGIFLEEEVKDESELADAQHQQQQQEEPTKPAEKTIFLPTAEAPEEQQEEETAPEPPAPRAKARAPKPPKAEASETPAEPAAPAKAAPKAAAPADGPEWMTYVISHITMTDYAGKQIGDLTPAQVKTLKTGWVEKYAAKIAQSPDKQHEADMLSAAYKHHFPA